MTTCSHGLPLESKCNQCVSEALATADAFMEIFGMKRSKHGNTKTVIDGEEFDSKREAARWCELILLQKAGEIELLRRQVPFELVPSVVLAGRKKPAVKYIADFTYYVPGAKVVEDAKSPHLRKDPTYRLKKHLMKHVHGIDVVEV